MNDMIITDKTSLGKVIQISCDTDVVITTDDFHVSDAITHAALTGPGKKIEGKLEPGTYHVQVLAIVVKLEDV